MQLGKGLNGGELITAVKPDRCITEGGKIKGKTYFLKSMAEEKGVVETLLGAVGGLLGAPGKF